MSPIQSPIEGIITIRSQEFGELSIITIAFFYRSRLSWEIIGKFFLTKILINLDFFSFYPCIYMGGKENK
jgi:hypothetical protein